MNQKAESQILQNFITGLKPQVLKQVISLIVTTANKALDDATTFEMANRKKSGRVAGLASTTRDVETLASKIATAAIDEFHGQNQSQPNSGRGRGGLGRGGQQQNASPNGCEYFGYRGHSIDVCNIKKKDIAAGINLQRSQYNTSGRISQGSGRGSERGRGIIYNRGVKVIFPFNLG